MDVTNSKSISVDTNRARFFNSQLFSVFRLTMTSGVQRDAGALSQCANIIRSSGLFKNNLTKTRQTDKESLFFAVNEALHPSEDAVHLETHLSPPQPQSYRFEIKSVYVPQN